MTTSGPPSDLGPLRAQDTLEPLAVDDGAVVSVSGHRRYPVREGLVFMGYAARDSAQIEEFMEEERDWQADPATVGLDEDFLRTSAPRAVQFINVVSGLTGGQPGLRALELGAGSGWVSWLLARAGFDPWLCDFEANSLFSGWVYDHPRLGPGKRIVADARYPPFADGSFDVVLLKEFAHHVADTGLLFAEANRVLRPGGLLAMMEPVRSVKTAVYELRNPDPHKGHSITWPDRYLWQLRRSGFERCWSSVAYGDQPRHATVRRLQQRAAHEVAGLRHTRNPLVDLHLRLLGGGSLVYAGRKVHEAPVAPRPEMLLIDPATLRLEAADQDAWAGCRALVDAAAARLDA